MFSHRQLWLSPPCRDSVFHTMSANDRQPGSGVQSLQAASRSSQSNRAVLSVGVRADEELWACPEAEGAGNGCAMGNRRNTITRLSSARATELPYAGTSLL
ncbi:hypothetical protein ACRRTK_002891 [Alexandromys fortis]